MANVTYLLGAGASCECLPTYANFSERFTKFVEFLTYNHQVFPADKAKLVEITTMCKKIESELLYHSTPDTIAKKYFHQKDDGEKNLKELKIVLILFFIYEQCIGNEIITASKLQKKLQLDRRYDSFIASILEPVYSEIKIRSGFNILTWNYDLQFEICFHKYCKENFETSQGIIQSVPLFFALDEKNNHLTNRFSIVHLNGIAYSKKSEESDSWVSPFGSHCRGREELAKVIIEHYNCLSYPRDDFDSKSLLSFAWERDPSNPGSKNVIDKIQQSSLSIAFTTEVLVIIGYSFPVFNRTIDMALFANMNKLTKIYIQSPQAEEISETIIEAFSSRNEKVNTNSIKLIKSTDYFHIPIEWDQEIPPEVDFMSINWGR